MKADIRLIALDMDGTLLDDDHATIPPRNTAALRAAAAQGVKIAIASGRCWALIRETAAQLDTVHYGITSNGAFTWDAAARKAIRKFPMDQQQCLHIIDVLNKWNVVYELYVDGENYVESAQLDGVELHFHDILTPEFFEVYLRNTTLVPDMRAFIATCQPEKFDIFYIPPEHRAEILADLHRTGELSYAGALGVNLEMTAPNVHKGRALAALAAELGLTSDQVMAFGDADNDLEMLEWAGWSFAMENATDQAKAAAKFVTGLNREGGVGMAVEKFCLLP